MILNIGDKLKLPGAIHRPVRETTCFFPQVVLYPHTPDKTCSLPDCGHKKTALVAVGLFGFTA
jgi:hypothetical protein